VIYGRDISERKRLEHRLTQALEDKEAILHSISDLMVSLDAKWRFSYANAHAQTYLPADYLGRHYFDVYPHNRSSIYEQYYQQVFDTGQTVTFEAQASVSGRWLEYRVYPHRGGIVIYAQNIDERKRLAAQLERTLAQRDAFLDSISDGMVSLDANWHFSYANRYARQYLPADYLGTSYWDIFPENRGNIFHEKYQQVFDTKQPVTFEAQASVSGRWLEFRVYPYQHGIIINASSIEERRRLQAQLETSLRERDATFESITDSVTVLGKDWRYRYANSRALINRHGDNIVGASYWDIFPNSRGNIFERKFQQAFNSKEPVFFEAQSDLGGTWREFRVYPSQDGETITIYSSDVTERKQLEQQLQNALKERDATFDSITERVSVLDRDLRYVYVNKHAKKLMPESPVGKTVFELLGDDTYDKRFIRKFRQVFATGQPVQFEYVSPSDNSWRDIRVYPSVDGNTITVYSGDISERKKLEQQLQNALADKEIILNSISDMMMGLDNNWHITYVNRRVQTFLSKDVLGKHYFDVFPDNQGSIFHEKYQQVFDTQQPVTFEAQGSRSGYWLEHRVYPHQGGLVIYATDISERKKLEQDLQDALAQKDMLMKELHHRTKNNLQLVASMLALQARQLEDESAKAALKNSQSRIHTLAEIHSMLYRQDASTLDTASYLQLLAENVIDSTSQAPVRLECNLAAVDLPLEHTIALGLITNEIITNALKYAFAHANNPDADNTIWLQLEQDDSIITMTVHNNGVPLTENRSQSLGMTIIQALTEQLGGQFTIQNVAGGVLAQVVFTLSKVKG
jgi:PAS domain S-box-containing protein